MMQPLLRITGNKGLLLGRSLEKLVVRLALRKCMVIVDHCGSIGNRGPGRSRINRRLAIQGLDAFAALSRIWQG